MYPSAVCAWSRMRPCWLAKLARMHNVSFLPEYAHAMPHGCFLSVFSSVSYLCSLCSQLIKSSKVCPQCSITVHVRRAVFGCGHAFHLNVKCSLAICRKQWNTEEQIGLMWEPFKHLSNCSNSYPLMQLACGWETGSVDDALPSPSKVHQS